MLFSANDFICPAAHGIEHIGHAVSVGVDGGKNLAVGQVIIALIDVKADIGFVHAVRGGLDDLQISSGGKLDGQLGEQRVICYAGDTALLSGKGTQGVAGCNVQLSLQGDVCLAAVSSCPDLQIVAALPNFNTGICPFNAPLVILECPVGIGQGNGIGLTNVFQLNDLPVKAGFRLVALDIRQNRIIGFFDLGIPSKG